MGSDAPNIRRNIYFKLVEAAIMMACSIGQYALLTSYLAPSEVGLYSVVSTWVFFFCALAMSSALWTITSREIAQGMDISGVITNSIVLQVVVASLVMLGLIVVLAWVPYPNETKLIILVVMVPAFIGAPLLLTHAILGGRELIPYITITTILGAVLEVSTVWFALQYDWPMVAVCLLGNGAMLLTEAMGYCRAPLHHYFRFALISVQHLWSLFKETLPILITGIAASIYIRIDILMIEHMIGSASVAEYSTAYVILDNLMILSGALMGALYPTFARLAAGDQTEMIALCEKTVRMFVFFLFPLAVIISFCATPILVLFFGSEYAGGSLSLKILMLAALFAWLNGPMGAILIVYRKQQLYMWGTIAGAFLNVVGNLFLIPLLGHSGAAVATALTEMSLCIFSMVMVHKTVGYSPLPISWRILSRATLARVTRSLDFGLKRDGENQ